MPPNKLRRIALFAFSDNHYRSGLFASIGNYGRVMGNWVFYAHQPLIERLQELNSLKLDGIIASATAGFLAECQKLQAPVIAISNKPTIFPTIGVDNQSVANMAYDYFSRNGYRRFGFVGYDSTEGPYENLSARFKELVQSKGAEIHVHHRQRNSEGRLIKLHTPPYQDNLRAWIQQLPRPIAIFCENDGFGVSVCQRCLEAEIRVPEEVSVMGVGNQHPLCDLSWPSLSSIELPLDQLGQEAAEALDQMIQKRGKIGPRASLFKTLPATRVVARGSSDSTAVEDRLVREAMTRIRDDLAHSLDIDAMASALHVSRSTLEKRFKSATGHTPFQEARRLQLDRVKVLLQSTDHSLESVAESCYFCSAAHLSMIFKKQIGMSPGAFRRTHRMSASTADDDGAS